MFGTNHAMMLSNDSKNGMLTNGIFVQGQEESGSTMLPVVANGNDGAGMVLIFCSGMVDGKPLGAAYMVRFGFKGEFCTEDRTAAALYAIFIEADGKISSELVVGNHGEDYKSADLWKIEATNKKITVTGPKGPCRYAVLSNIVQEEDRGFRQDICLATGEPSPARGAVKINLDGVEGIVQKPSTVHIQLDHKVVGTFEPHDLVKVENGWAFRRKWEEGEVTVGLFLVRVFMVRKHVTTGTEQQLEMVGSPVQLVKQKDSVKYALNVSGPAYNSVGNIVYTSEHRQYANFSYDFNSGSRCLAYGATKFAASIPQLMNNTQDGFMYVTRRCIYGEPVDEKKVIYKVKIPNGDYILRYHTEEEGQHVTLNGRDITAEIQAAKDKAPTHLTPNLTAYYADIPVTVTEGQIVLDTKLYIGGFALLDKDYKDPVKSQTEMEEENQERQVLMNKLDPLVRSVELKKLTVVGWSPNLLKNASGELGDLSHWNVTGAIKTYEGGHGTEKSFITSHMECTKYQEVDLTEHFAREYLDTCPDIEVTEWYKEGVCGGGFYEMEAILMDEDGNALKNYKVPRTGRIYNNNAWTQAGTIFTDYPKGVRIVSISSMGKDDKFWAGHFGTIISDSVIRVKRESIPAVDDSSSDIKLVSMLVNKMTDLSKIFSVTVPSFDTQFEKQVEVPHENLHRKPQRKRKREIRVFVSSTFKDFNKEREAIIKKAFREINRMCSKRGVFFSYVDLRWGISSEQSSHGQTIAICLQEIDRCRPYFIALLGSRFGWSQNKEKEDNALMKTYDYAVENIPNLKWIDEHRFDTSVTQLEIFHGVLNNVEEGKDRSFFYLRKPKKMDNLSPEDQKLYASESEWHEDRQMALRNAIKDKRQLNIREFDEPEEVADHIKKDLMWSIDQDFPIGTELTPLEREREAHEAFAEVRCQVYIGREEYFTTITENMEKKLKQPFVLLGESGCGKSALVANWVKRVGEKYPDAFMFVHFIGSSAESADYLKLLRRLYEELKLYFKLDLTIPTADAQVIRDLPKWLRLVASKHQCIIVLDALNQLDSGTKEDGPEHELTWIPDELPENVFLLLSTLPGRAKDAILSRKWPSMQVSPLEPSQKMEIITGYLEGIYSKTLSDEQKQMIVDAPQTNNPLYLRSLLDEVRLYGSFRTLTKRIQDYLQADNPGDLFAKILERMEEDYALDDEAAKDLHVFMRKLGDRSRLNMTREATTAIWCSNRGMSESEITELLQVPSAIWSPFYLSLAEGLVNKNGILNFFHDHLRQAVEKKYLSSPEAKKAGYLKLADFFSTKELDDRVVDELPFLLARAGELDRLKELITKFEVFRSMAKTEEGKFELIKAWQLLGDYSLVEKEYLQKLSEIPEEDKQTQSYIDLLDLLGDFFVDLGLYNGAKEVFMKLNSDLEEKFAVSHGTVVYNPFNHSWKYRSKHPNVIDALHNLGLICEKQNELDQGEAYYKDSISRQNRIVTPSEKLQLCQGLLGLASIMNLKDNMVLAKRALIRSLELATDVLGKQHHFVAAILSKLGDLCYSQGRVEEALGYYLQDLKLSRSEVGVSHPRIGRILSSIGKVYDDMNDDLAGQLYEASLAELLDTYGSTHIDVAKVRFNLGSYCFATNRFERARFQFNEAYNIFCSVVGEDHPDSKATKSALSELP
ncbi:hypothetical protein FSP39_004391 [Pinctada imbricata]|uniref:FBA domain-containing protein n=1 Tax=Pinctada imbricata TaxID=66713 RepID=A0AA89C537_PINIB|nr:hypothetical protein FSP39_004391 [Pinctada imbricata]